MKRGWHVVFGACVFAVWAFYGWLFIGLDHLARSWDLETYPDPDPGGERLFWVALCTAYLVVVLGLAYFRLWRELFLQVTGSMWWLGLWFGNACVMGGDWESTVQPVFVRSPVWSVVVGCAGAALLYFGLGWLAMRLERIADAKRRWVHRHD